MEQEVQTNPLLVKKEEGICTITLNRPRVLNAMTVEMFSLLQKALAEAADDPEVEVLLLRGAGGNFCSGADLTVLTALREKSEADEALAVINDFIWRLHQMPKPVIAVVEGVAVGAGLNLALHADFVIAATDAVLQEPFVQIGLTTDFGGTYLLPQLVGTAWAKRLALLGEKISGQTAERIGLIYRAVEPALIEQEVEALVAAVRRLPRQAYAVTKEGLGRCHFNGLEYALAWEKQQQPALVADPAFQSLVRAKMKRT
ncbi:enoyl-CoA hydratase/isomerase family protein [Brevibacillus sp. SAFN-007a]|uniref:enoyl-CoA hydratase/isomerase family protein n=1 Tax=Brevibacillus sp. SAFN-007a TaxID=3436862 RepID=UPI003F80FD04